MDALHECGLTGPEDNRLLQGGSRASMEPSLPDALCPVEEYLGVILDGIYACETGKFREMYGKDYFIHTACPDDLADQAACLIKTLVKGC